MIDRIAKYIYLIGILFRNNQIFKILRFFEKTEKWSIGELEEYQFSKLRELLKFSLQNSKYYQDLFRRSGICLTNIQSLSDIKVIPLTNKEEIIKNSDLIQIENCGERLFYSETSGSTGQPLVFYRNKEWDAWHNASVIRGYAWHGINPWDRNGYLWGYNISPKARLKTKILDILQNRFRIFSYDESSLDEFLNKLQKAKFLGGYSSMIYELAKRANAIAGKYNFENLKIIKGTSEKIFNNYQDEALRAFGKKIISEYGSAEAGIIAFECPAGKMHINMESVIVEEVDGEIVVTNLVSKSFPIIRYRLGDYIKLGEDDGVCSCGLSHRTILEVTGRIGAVIHGLKKQYPSLTLYYIFKNIAVQQGKTFNYNVVQEKKGSLDFNIEGPVSEFDKNVIIKEAKKYFDDDIYVEILDNYLREDFSSKRKDFVSKIKA